MAKILRRDLISASEGPVTLLDACYHADHANRVILYFSKATEIDHVHVNPPWRVVDRMSVDGAWALHLEHGGDEPVQLVLFGVRHVIHPATSELDILAGHNAFLSVRNKESSEIVADWFTFHANTQGADSAVIFDRALPTETDKFAKRLEKQLAKIERGPIIVVSANVPFGDPALPAEQHPFCVPTAPGKDRMVVPDPDPQHAPLHEVHLFEIMRQRFLQKARAVANIDVYDLLLPDVTISVFDQAVKAKQGVLGLAGQMSFPWRPKSKKDIHFGDHAYVQFDANNHKRRWVVAPAKSPKDTIWKFIRIANADVDSGPPAEFARFMALRHPSPKISKIVPKTSLVEHPNLRQLANEFFGKDPVAMPSIKSAQDTSSGHKTSIVTTMKNEGPFILEWLAYHRVIGVEGFLVYTNDCTDGTDTFLDLLQSKGYVQHRDNPFKSTDLKPQHAALQAAEKEPTITDADWVICMDVDEYINIKVGEGTLTDLYTALPDANMISCTWRLFGNADVHEFDPRPIIEQFDTCAEEITRKPHQAWGFKTLHRNIGIFKKLGVHRPKGLKPQLWDQINWVNGSGHPLPHTMYRNAWRSTFETVGYDMVQLNHYAVRSAESFLVKRDRGRVNHVDRDQGLAYWFRMNNNAVPDTSIQRMIPKLHAELEHLLADPDIRLAHENCIKAHRAKIDELRATDNYSSFYQDLTGDRMQKLSRMHHHFGANVFLAGPDVVPDEVVNTDHPTDFFFTVDRVETQHS